MTEKVKFTNFMIEKFQRDISFQKLRVSEDLSQELKFELFKLVEILTNGPEAKALIAAKNELIRTDGKKDILSFDHPKVQELMNLESGIEFNKLYVCVKDIPKALTPEDMRQISWLIEFKDE